MTDDEPPIEIPIEDALDLHPFQPRDIPGVVDDYLHAAHAAGFREVRLIHGRGVGVQRARVHQVLRAHPLVKDLSDDPRSHLGATLVLLVEQA